MALKPPLLRRTLPEAEEEQSMKKIGICNNKGGVGKTTFCFCLGGAFAEMGKKVLMVDMDQQGSLSSSFLKNINELPFVITDALLDGQMSMKTVLQKTTVAKAVAVQKKRGRAVSQPLDMFGSGGWI